MKTISKLLAAGLLLANVGGALAEVHYVDVNSSNAMPPYTSWGTAATNIQDAVDAAVAGAEIAVTNGIYATGGRAMVSDYMMNRVAVDKSLTVRSINGPQFTTIEGGHSNRCVYLANEASLSGFTLTNGHISDANGAGVFCESQTAVVSNCVVAGNFAVTYDSGGDGGGASGGTLNNCTLTGNSASAGGGAAFCTLNNCTLTGNSGGGAFLCTLNNCTVTGNSAHYFGGAYDSTLNNCIVYFNSNGDGAANYDSSSTLNYCCTTPQPTNGVGNISLDPQLASAWRLSAASPCRGTGSAAYVSGTDIDGESWASRPSIGCDEYYAGALTGPLSVGISALFTNVLMGFPVQLTALIEGRTAASSWDFGNGITATNQAYAAHAWTALGDYAVVLRGFNESQPGGISATVTVHVVAQPVHYVAVANGNPVAPYTSWNTATTNIQDAVNAATVPGALVLVSNGIYTTTPSYDAKVRIDRLLTVRSVNGPQFTVIDGGGYVRCVYLTNGACLSGFTLTNGLAISGGGAYGGTLNNCTLSGNSATDRYSYFATFTAGGGACRCTLNNCTLTGNQAWSRAAGGTQGRGGGAYDCTLNNCTLIGNSAYYSGGADNSTLNNCIAYFNTGANYYVCTLNYSCTIPQLPNGIGNITNAPLFVDLAFNNLRLQSNSPCINAGLNAFAPAGPDLDGNPRIVGGSVDMGAYEFQSLDLLNFGVVSNQFGFNITGQSNWVIVLEASSDFTNWIPLTTNTLGAHPFPFRDPTLPNLPRRFYRARMK